MQSIDFVTLLIQIKSLLNKLKKQYEKNSSPIYSCLSSVVLIYEVASITNVIVEEIFPESCITVL